MRVFLTGASSGLGEALARHYAAKGAILGLVARREPELRALAESLQGNAAVATYQGDVRVAQDLARAASDFMQRFGVPDVVIANAGISRGVLTEAPEDLEVWKAIFETNVLGIVHTFAPFVVPMRDQGSGVLAGVASVAGFRGLPGSGAYCGSKSAAITYLESLRVELRGTGVSVVTICPGFVETPLTARNPYRMPFLITADKAAVLMANAIEDRKRFYVLPWQMALLGRALRCLPRPLFDRIVAKRARKPRD
ncbi:MAG: SDR family oxidoreductase [Burkholderiales bacterium]